MDWGGAVHTYCVGFSVSIASLSTDLELLSILSSYFVGSSITFLYMLGLYLSIHFLWGGIVNGFEFQFYCHMTIVNRGIQLFCAYPSFLL